MLRHANSGSANEHYAKFLNERLRFALALEMLTKFQVECLVHVGI